MQIISNDAMKNANSPREQAENYLAACAEYTHPYERQRLIEDWAVKSSTVQNVVHDFEKRMGGGVSRKSLLDIGFGNGSYAIAFARAGARVSGLEINPILVQIAEESSRREGVSADFRLYDGAAFPYPDASFDYAFSVSTFEHVSSQQEFLREAERILKPGGKFYLSFPNRWRPREPHTGILFMGYFPRIVAQWLLRTVWRRNSIQELNLSFHSYFSMKRLLRGTSLRVVFETGGAKRNRKLLKKILASWGIHHSAILGAVMVVLEKKPSSA